MKGRRRVGDEGRREEPNLAQKALRLATLSITLVTIVSFSTIAISVYQEVTYVIGDPGSLRPSIGLVQEKGETKFRAAFTVPNRGIYPLAIAFNLTSVLNGSRLVTEATPPVTIPPGEEKEIEVMLSINLGELIGNRGIAEKLLFGNSTIGLAFTFSVALQPFLSIEASLFFNQTLGPALSDFDVDYGLPEPANTTHVRLPLTVSLRNRSLFPLDGELTVRIATTPRHPSEGDYGQGSVRFSAQPGEALRERVDLYVELDDVGPGAYSVEFTFRSGEFRWSWRSTVSR